MGRDHLLQPAAKRVADTSDAPPAPGRSTQISAAPTTLEGLGVQALRVAHGAVGQLIGASGKLVAANHARRAEAAVVLEARGALTRLDTAIAQLTMIRTQIDSAAIELQLPMLTGQRAALAQVIDPLLATQAQLAQTHAQAQGPAPTQPPAAPAQAATPHAQAPATPGGFVAPTPVKPAEVAPATKVDDAVPSGPGYAPTWKTIHDAAAGDATALAALDVGWIDGLDGYIVASIDGGFTKAAQTAAFNTEVKKNQQLAKLDGQQREDKLAELERDFAARKQSFPFSGTVAPAPAEGVTRDEGRLLARADFMAWGSHVLGSPAAVKAHFQALRKVSKVQGSLFLWGPAAARLEAAWDWFERTYPGNTFFQTDVGFGLRGVHHEQHPLSYLGHALGFSVDFRAYDNPSFLKDGGVGMFLLSRIGGHQEGGKDVGGATKMKLPDYKKVQELGRASERGEDVGEEGTRLLEAAGASYDQMAATSDNFKATLAPHMTALRQAQQTWFEIQGVKVKLKSAELKLKAATTAAGAKVGKTASQDDRDAAIAGDSAVADATKERDELAAEIETKRRTAMEAADKVFKPWADKLRAEAAANLAGHEAEAALGISFKAADELLQRVTAAKTKKALTALLATPNGKLVFDVDKLSAIDDFAELHAAMKARATAVRTAKYNAQANGVIEKAIARLGDPKAIFGGAAFNAKSKTWVAQRAANNPSLMQLAELGFARNDELAPGATPGKGLKQVFNREFIMAMTRFGWTTGASWGEIDTMHFDFLDGYSAVKSKGFGHGGSFGPQP